MGGERRGVDCARGVVGGADSLEGENGGAGALFHRSCGAGGPLARFAADIGLLLLPQPHGDERGHERAGGKGEREAKSCRHLDRGDRGLLSRPGLEAPSTGSGRRPRAPVRSRSGRVSPGVRLRERVGERVALSEHVRLVPDLELELPLEDVDELHLARERVELVAGACAGCELGLDRLEARLVPGGEEMILRRAAAVHGGSLVPAHECRRGLLLEDVGEADAERVADARDRRQRGRCAVPFELTDEPLGQASGRGELLDREPTFPAERADPGADLGCVAARGERRRSWHEPIIRRFSPSAMSRSGNTGILSVVDTNMATREGDPLSTMLLVPLEDIVVFPNMNVTLTVDVGDEERVLLVPRTGNDYATRRHRRRGRPTAYACRAAGARSR